MDTMRARWGAAAATAVLLVAGTTATATATVTATVTASERSTASRIASEPVVTEATVKERTDIRFRTVERRTAKLPRGVRKVAQPGRVGVRVRVVRITSQDGVEVDRKVVRNFVARKPVTRVVLVGTYVKPAPAPQKCDPNYSGACVPIASDVDCAGGSGNGPAYVAGPVKVVGSDIYDLDADGDGYGCD